MNEATTNPALGMILFTLGGLAGAIFTQPFKKVKNWAYESYWMFYAIVGLLVVPVVLALVTVPNLGDVLKNTPSQVLARCAGFGALWGFGGLTWGLMIRYLGVGLGLAIGCGLCAATGTLIPPIVKGEAAKLIADLPAQITLGSVVVSLLGITFVGLAGVSKEGELTEEQKKKAVAEYNFKKGMLVALFSGIASAGMGFGLAGGGDMADRAVAGGTAITWSGIPVLVVVLFGGLVVNFTWCLLQNIKNKTMGDYTKKGAPIVGNIFFAGLAGAIWAMQFVCQKTGEPKMGEQAYIGFASVMASAILFSSLLGLFQGEWKGTGKKTKGLLALGIALLLGSSVISGYSGYIKKQMEKSKADKPAAEAPAAT